MNRELKNAIAHRRSAEDQLAAAELEVERAERELAHMTKWVNEQRAAGRPEHELTWGNCVKETGICKPAA